MIPGIFAAGAMGQGGVIPPSGTPYYDAVIADSPVLYLRFTENVSGNPANSGSASLSASSYNNSARGQASLSGDTGDYSVGISTGAGLRGPSAGYVAGAVGKANDFTIEAIINATSLASSGVIISAVTGGTGNNGAELRIISGKVTLIRKNIAVVATADTTLSTDTRYHVACRVASDGTYTFFLDGAPDGTGAGSDAFATNQNATQIGYETSAGNVFVGRIDEVAVYHSALSDARIAAHAAAMAP